MAILPEPGSLWGFSLLKGSFFSVFFVSQSTVHRFYELTLSIVFEEAKESVSNLRDSIETNKKNPHTKQGWLIF